MLPNEEMGCSFGGLPNSCPSVANLRMKSGAGRLVKDFMSEQFFYVQFLLRPVSGIPTLPVGSAQQVVLEVPRKLIEDWKEEKPDQMVTDQSIAANIARVVAVNAIFQFPNRPACEFDEPVWLEHRHPVMNARACDYHDNGIRAWVIKFGGITKEVEEFSESPADPRRNI